MEGSLGTFRLRGTTRGPRCSFRSDCYLCSGSIKLKLLHRGRPSNPKRHRTRQSRLPTYMMADPIEHPKAVDGFNQPPLDSWTADF